MHSIWEQHYNRAYMGFRGMGITPFTYIKRIVFPVIPVGVKIILYSEFGVKVAEFGADIRESYLEYLEFEMLETGCGAFKMVLAREPPVVIGYNYYIEVYLYEYTRGEPWFAGCVLERPKSGTSRIDSYEYGGYGYFYQLDLCKVDETYTNTEISAIVKDIMTTYVEPNTEIGYKESKIVYDGFEVTNIEFLKTSAKEAFARLAELAQNYVFGVDADRQFFFKPITTTVNPRAVLEVGKHMEELDYEEDTEGILNDIDIFGGLIDAITKTNFIVNVSDATSISTYGRRWGKLTIPEALASGDAQQWGDYMLSILKDPVEKAMVRDVSLFNQPIEVKGKALIHTLHKTDSESTLCELTIKKIKYRCTTKGVVADMELGELVIPISEQIVKMLRRAKMDEILMQINIEQVA